MIEILENYWRAFLWTDGNGFSGLAVTMWLLIVSVGIGFFISIPLAVARVSPRRSIAGPVWVLRMFFAVRRSMCSCS